MSKNIYKILIPIGSVLVGLIIGFIILLVTGYDISNFISAIYKGMFNNVTAFGNWLQFSSYFILTGLSVAFAYRVGLFNIGAEGQFIVATIVASALGTTLNFSGAWLLILIVATISGMLYAFIPGVLKAYLGVSEVVVTIMLNWIAYYYVNYLIQTSGDSTTATDKINDAASLNVDFFKELTVNSALNIGFIIAILMVVVYWFIMNKMKFGYELKAVGFSPFAAEYAGIKKKKSIILSMMISGMFAGLAGAIYSLSEPGVIYVVAGFRNYGFDGIAVAMLGQLSGVGIFLSGLLFSALRQSQSYMLNIPKEIIDVIIAIIIISSAFGAIINAKIAKRGDK